MLDVTASYGTPFDFIEFFHTLLTSIFNQTFIDCVSNYCTHFSMSIYQMCLQVMEGYLI